MEELHPSVLRVQSQPRIEQRSDGWFQTRGKLLTASDAAAALDIPPFASFKGSAKNELVRRKAQQAIGLNEFTGNEATKHGQLYEQEALDLYAERCNQRVLDFGLLIHPEHRWLGGSPDGITASGILLECKCPMMRKIGDGAVPHHYHGQASALLHINPPVCFSCP